MVELFVFIVAGAMCLAGALGVILLRNPVHAALSLVLTLFGIAVLFTAQEAHFLAVVQVIVYAGAIVVLFLFVLMLLGVDKAEKLELGGLPGQKVAAGIFAVGALSIIGVFIVASDNPVTGARSLGAPIAPITLDADNLPDGITVDPGSGEFIDEAGNVVEAVPNVTQLSRSLFSDFVYAFELTSVLLVIAVIGVVVLARRTPADDDEVVS